MIPVSEPECGFSRSGIKKEDCASPSSRLSARRVSKKYFHLSLPRIGPHSIPQRNTASKRNRSPWLRSLKNLCVAGRNISSIVEKHMALIRVFPILFFLVVFFGINLAYAQITSFSANPASIQSGQVTTYLWSSENLGGIKLVFPCVSGIKYYYESGAPLACGSTILDLATNGAYSVSAANLSLSGASVEVKAVPKTAEGIYDESAPSYAPLTIYPVSAIITEFTSNTDTVVSGNDAVFSWNSQYITGVNFNFSCAENVKIFYAGSEVPCGQIAFGTNLAAQSQISVSFSNISQSKKTISVTVIPAMDDGTYDATRSKSVTLVVEPPPPKIPKVYVYSPSLVALSSGETTVISWGGIYISGVNMNITCAYGITASSSADPSQTLPCGTYAFSENLPATSTHALSFKNTVSGIVRVRLKIITFLDNNTYDATLAKEILIDVSRETPPEPVTAPSEPIAEETSNTVSPSESVESQSQTTEVLQPASAPKQEPTPSAQRESSRG